MIHASTILENVTVFGASRLYGVIAGFRKPGCAQKHEKKHTSRESLFLIATLLAPKAQRTQLIYTCIISM